MNQLCKVCGEPAAGFHFGAFTCEGCKSFFGRTYNNISAIAGCKNNGDCVINKKNRTACKACRLRKCLLVGMSKSGSRYGRRSNWFKIHCLLQEQQTTGSASGGSGGGGGGGGGGGSGSSGGIANFEQLARLHQIQARQTYQDKTNPCIKSASMSPTALSLNASAHSNTPTPPSLLTAAAKFLNGVDGNHQHRSHAHHQQHNHPHHHQHLPFAAKAETHLSDTPSDSGASSAGDAADDATSSVTSSHQERNCSSAHQPVSTYDEEEADARARRHKQLLQIYRSHSEPLRSPFAQFALGGNLPPPVGPPPPPPPPPSHSQLLPTALKEDIKRVSESVASAAAAAAAGSAEGGTQEEPIDLSLKAQNSQRRCSSQSPRSDSTPSSTPPRPTASPATLSEALANVIQKQKTTPLDLTLVRTQTLTG